MTSKAYILGIINFFSGTRVINVFKKNLNLSKYQFVFFQTMAKISQKFDNKYAAMGFSIFYANM